jgi:tetratricopeptide (TPR) repeat protein
LPYAGLADHHLASTVANAQADPAMSRARELAHEALKRDPDLPEAHGMLGIVAGPYERDWKEAERRFGLAMAREPVPWHVRQWHAYFYLFPVGRFEEALQEPQRTIVDDPLSQVNYLCLGAIAEGLGLEQDAGAAYAKALELDPQFWWAWARLGLQHAVAGRRADALARADKAMAIFPLSPLTIGLRAGVLRSTGDTQQAEALLAQLPAGSYGAPVALTCVHLVCGEIESRVRRTFAGLRSRWMMPRSCAASRPSVCRAMAGRRSSRIRVMARVVREGRYPQSVPAAAVRRLSLRDP